MPVLADAAPHLARRLPKNHNATITVAAVVLVDGAYFCTMPLLPAFLGKLGVAPASHVAAWTGILMGVTPAIAAAAGPWWGKIGDRTGLWWMAVRGTAALAAIWLASAFVQNVYQLLGLRILLGFLGGYQTLVMALATHGAAPGTAGPIIARVQITQIATAAVAPMAGGYLSAIAGIRTLFGASSVLCFAALAMFAAAYRNVPSGDAEVRHIAPRARLSALRWLAFLLFLQAMIDRSFQPLSALWAAAHANTAAQSAQLAGIILSVGALGDGLAAWWCGRTAGAERRRLLLRSAAGSAVCFLLSYALTVPVLLGLRVLLSVFGEGGLTVLYTMASRLVPERTRSSDFGLLSSCVLLGQGTGALAAGLLAARDIRFVFYLNAGLFGLMLLLVQRSRLMRRIAAGAGHAGYYDYPETSNLEDRRHPI
jgi:MFS transporter, DHA1 family, multidrug resistance protein